MAEEPEVVAGEFEVVPFAKGRFRLVYKGVYATPPSEKRQECVVKVERDEHSVGHAFGRPSIEIHDMAKSLAKDFNQEKRTSKSIEYADMIAGKVDHPTYHSLRNGEVVIVEEYVPGNFKKWCNNYGHISEGAKVLEGFMHWSWMETGGEKMIGDMQGVEEDARYLLTDPAVMSNSKGAKYGPTDTGVEGIAMFFAHHYCNEVCIDLPRPILGIEFQISEEARRELASVSSSTAYAEDLKLPCDYRDMMMQIFSKIASS